MPLPKHAVVINGGCNCRAIRYKIEIPSFENRFLHPTKDQSGIPENAKIRFPMSLVCHCNDCRRATGALVVYGYACLMSWVSFQLLPRSPSTTTTAEAWVPATDVFPPATFAQRADTYLSFYDAKTGATRSFCGRCGTSLTYSYAPMPEPWPRFLDIWTGTVDREGLETGWFVPERHVHVDVEVGWIGRLACEGSGGLPRHKGGSCFED